MKKTLLILFALLAKHAFAQENTLQLPPVYTDNMVLQRNIPLKIQGKAPAGLKVTLEINNQQHTATAGQNGVWEITTHPMDAGGPYILQITTVSETLTFSNVMIGEVWLCSGQSNMAFPLKRDADFEKIKDRLENRQIRFYHMKPRWETQAVSWEKPVLDSLNHFDYFKETNWTVCTESTAKEFSAIGYSFGKMLADSLHIPIGLIQNAVGGSPVEAWIPKQTLESLFPALLVDWKENKLIQEWVRERAALNIRKSGSEHQKHPYEPGYLFTAGIQPLLPYPVNGIIWYQGESNVHEQMQYDKLFPSLVDCWRSRWNIKELPFLYVQLSGINRPLWPEFRDIQRMLMQDTPYTYMAVSSDRGDSLDVHPPKKQEIGQRLARWALNKNYGKKNIIPSGPLYRSVALHGAYAYLSFDHSSGLRVSGGEELRTFEVAGPDGIFYEGKALIEGNQVKVWSEKVENILQVRYAWQPFTWANLVNQANLPASTFKTENKEMELNHLIKKLPDYPLKGGIAAPFVGIHRNHLIVAGGCNFPGTPASEGGNKVFYNSVYALDLSGETPPKQWKKLTSYPCNVAYGSYVNTPEGIICIGGQNESGTLSHVTLIQYDEKTADVIYTPLPPLPVAHHNGCAVILKDSLFIAGGLFADNQNGIYCLPLHTEKKEWKKLKNKLREIRQQPVLFTQRDQLFLAGGYDEEKAYPFTDVMKFNFENAQWEKYDEIKPPSDLPATFIGTTAVYWKPDITLFVGGVNYERFTSALQRVKKTKDAIKAGETTLVKSLQQAGKEYMNQTPEWYRFQTSLITYDHRKKQWNSLGKSEKLARAGAGVCLWENKLFLIGGELKPGVRTEEVNCFMLQ